MLTFWWEKVLSQIPGNKNSQCTIIIQLMMISAANERRSNSNGITYQEVYDFTKRASNCFRVVHLPVLLAIKGPMHPCSPRSSRSSLYFMEKWLPQFLAVADPICQWKRKIIFSACMFVIRKVSPKSLGSQHQSCYSSKISKW